MVSYRFSAQKQYFCLMCAVCPTNFTFLDLIIVIILGEGLKFVVTLQADCLYE